MSREQLVNDVQTLLLSSISDRLLSQKITTGSPSWRYESWILASTSWPLILTYILQYSLTVTSVLVVGRLGTKELGAVSLGSMTVNITGYAVYQGLATALDTLCAQAYGSGRHKLVGMHLQRMLCLLWCTTIPIGVLWVASPWILAMIVPEIEIAYMAGSYLRVMLLGAPGWAAFEAGKKFVQAQGIFSANLGILLILAPLNVLLHWLFVWNFEFGFLGAPFAVALTNNLMPLLLLGYVRFIDGSQCWGGLVRNPFDNWGPMVKLALPGFIMIEAEWLAFEILTLGSSFLGTDSLATQSIAMTLATLGSQVPVPLSIAAATRVANLIGAGEVKHARLAGKVAIAGSLGGGVLNAIAFAAGREYIPQFFTNDPAVLKLAGNVMYILAVFQLFDASASACNGLLRGIGRQKIGGYTALGAFYLIGLPLAYLLGFRFQYGFLGLWIGPAIGSGVVAGIEGVFLANADWDTIAVEVKIRDALFDD